ncbi:hypothetical protein EOA27_13935 [Mesorhizobium sp. M2A.F.Ca.ET.037.01.1.1]|nr:hypothetical protein EJ072_08685 [Mesorhizobium sp. M2A.F.Ca.ET.046.03.2.1]RUX18154.1 hypothetical protein EOA27_13935 [Mesorhizobium sp. M2A.F.Ca.ET.037.01.1.1]RUY10973.1 hypothetical protein EOA25_07235 [Mesorhizobium sp. M2A.F.Ca.ET.040.01.1.1]RVC65211.1 hypothetical protein EN759_22955 [Mesorhizobium sp. M00.F.Ca.ET.038.03.1.1]RVC79685.1 hypothetical protein EN766_06800 [Mesorhizobium sp. M2A.F.Ca.ET.046.02.1.1]RWA79096.1 MAG: hypothetical protein EOQ31_34295 [Mesorhizobium sp.]RWX6282
MRSLRMRQHDYQLDGRCVYCRVNLDSLPPDDRTDEHVVPLSLNGTLVIRDGACKECGCRVHVDRNLALRRL